MGSEAEHSRTTSRDWVRLALIALLLAGAALRLYNVNWDDFQHAHPDERHVTWVATSVTWPKEPGTLLDPLRTTLNPFRWPPAVHPPDGEARAFTYGHFPLYLLAGVSQFASQLFAPAEGGRWSDYDHIQLVGRVLSALFDTLTILLIFLLGRELFGRRVAILGAAFQTFAVMHIQLAHFATFDAIMATFVTLAILMGVRGARRGRPVDFLLAGVAGGLAIGSLARALPVLLPIGLAPLVRLWQENGNPLRWARWDEAQRRRAYLLVGLALAALLLAALTFALTNPFALIDSASFLKDVREQSRMVSGDVDFPYTRQYRGTPAFLYQIEQQVRWGLGWPLGIAGFLGVVWALVRLVRRRVEIGEIIVLAWFVPYFLINGTFMVKFMRYMVVLTPFLCLYAGQLIGSAAAWLGRLRDVKLPRLRFRLDGRVAAIVLLVVTLGWTALYALGFVNIYSRPHTWIQASRWIFENIPANATLAVEHWDDELPKSLRGDEPANPPARAYQHVTLPLYEEDTLNKYQIIKDSLRRADYVILATNRLYRSIPRMPQRYPMTIKYYDLLFGGELGFEQVAVFTSRPQLGPLVWVDDDADESFTVYDHPKPLIFEKVRQLTDEEWDAKLGDAWLTAVPGSGDKATSAKAAEEAEPRKSLLLNGPVDELPAVDDFRWAQMASQNAALGAFVWWLVLSLIGLAAAPLAFVVLGRLRDRGWALSRSLGLLVVGYLNWIGASLHLTQNRAWIIALFVLALAGVSALFFWRNQEEMLAHLRANWRLLLCIEALFAGAYAAFVVVRLFNPDLWQPWTGGEKFMEFAFLNAVLKSAYFPPYDPYFAGGTLNYYYYGQYLISLLIKLTGVTPSVAFNLAIPALFAMTVTGGFGVGYSLAGRRKDGEAGWAHGLAGGLLAAAFVALMGNLASVTQIVRSLGNLAGSQFQSNIPNVQALVRAAVGLWALVQGRPAPAFDYWDPSRVIPSTINEFPFWSFLFADLHPHMIALPFALLALGMALNLRLWPAVAGAGRYAVAVVAAYIPTWEEALAWLALPLTVGALAVINTWDLPTYLGVLILTYALRVGGPNERRLGLVKTVVFAAFLAGSSLLLYLPFFRSYAALSVGIGIVRGKADLWQWLTIWGAFVFLAVSYLVVELGRAGERVPLLRLARLTVARCGEMPIWAQSLARLSRGGGGGSIHAGALALLLALATLILFAALGYGVIALCLFILLGAALLFLRQRASPEASFVNVLFFAGFLLLCGVEVLFLRDFLQGGDYYRMNTLFKFYIQVWVMLGLAAGVTLPGLVAQVVRWRSTAGRRAWQIALIAVLAASFLFVPLGLPARLEDRFPGARPAIGTLDGMAYLSVGSYTWPDPSYRIELQYDDEAIRWLQANVKGTPVVAEAAISYYREGGLRVSTFTGLPTLVGMHQNEQRYGDMVGKRENDARILFDTTDVNQAERIIRELDISLIYIGQLERAPQLYSADGIAKFEKMAAGGPLREVYRNEKVVIYAVEGKLAGL